MRVKDLKLHNFKSFNGEHGLSFADRPAGLYFICGKNEAEPRLGGNGAGKSTLFDGLCWVLFGKTLRKLKAGEVLNWQSKANVWGKLLLEMADGDYLVHRGWGPNFLRLSKPDGMTVVVEQDQIDTLIGMSYEEFSHAVVLGQFSSMFFDLAPTDKLKLFSEVLNLERWIGYSDGAGKRAQTVDKRHQKLTSELQHTQGSLDQVGRTLEATRLAFKSHATEQAQRAAKLLAEYKSFEPEIKNQQSLWKNQKEHFAKLESAHGSALEEIEKIDRQLTKTEGDLREALHHQSTAGRAYDAVIASLKRVSTLGDECPHCNQRVTADHIHGQKELLQTEKARLLFEQANFATVVAQREEQSNKLKLLKRDKVVLKEKATKEYNMTLSMIQGHEKNITRLQANQEAARQSYESEKARPNPYGSQVKNLEAKKVELEQAITGIELLLEGTNAELSKAQHWVKGFKEVRLFMVEEALTFLEVEVNNALVGLGLENWRVSFDVEKENKTGGISKGFHVMIQSPHTDQMVPWEAWSGGETQRLRLSGAIGLSNLINDRAGGLCNLLVLDEPTEHLSPEGTQDLLNYLADYSKTEQKQVWLIDHHSLDFGDFSGSLLVTKNKRGSSIKEIVTARMQ